MEALLEQEIREPVEGCVSIDRDKQVPTDERPPSEVDSLPLVYCVGKVDTSQLKARLESHGEDVWHPDAQHGNNRIRRAFHDGLGVGSIIFRTCDDMMTTVLETPWWRAWRDELMAIFDQLAIPEERIIRCLLAGMPPGLHIPVHHDTGWWSMRSRRMHIPIYTDPAKVAFRAGRDEKHMERWMFAPDVAVELNNRAKHEVYNGWDRRRVHLIFDCVDEGVRVPAYALRPEEVVVQARRSVVVLESHERLDELVERVTKEEEEEKHELAAPETEGGEVGVPADGAGVDGGDADSDDAGSVVSGVSVLSAGTVSREDRDRDEDTRLMLRVLALHDPLRREAHVALARLGRRRADRAARARTARAVAKRAEQLGGAGGKQRLLFACKRFAQGELPADRMLSTLQELFGHTLQRTMEQDGLVLLVPDEERREALMRVYLEHRREVAGRLGNALMMPSLGAGAAHEGKTNGGESVARLPLGPRSFPQCRKSLPAFLIIGVQKCGTTALYDYLCEHPKICRAPQKEPHFFDWRWEEASRLKLSAAQARRAYTWFSGSGQHDGMKRKYALTFDLQSLGKDASLLSGEGTPSYLLGGTALARRVKAVAPNAHLIVCLRDPVKRAYSHYQMVVDPEGTPAQKRRRGEVGGRSFEEVAMEDVEELAGCGVTPGEDSDDAFDTQYCALRPEGHGSHSFIGRGLYAKQLRLWLREFPVSQISVVLLDDLKTPEGINGVCNRLWATMGLHHHRVEDTSAKNSRRYDPISPALAAKLKEYYAPHNQELYRLLGKDLGWEA